MHFSACAIRFEDPKAKQDAVEAIRHGAGKPVLILDTCQRLEMYGFDIPELAGNPVLRVEEERAAFERLARIAAGLESRILGELEVLGQVRTAYRQFRQAGGAENSILDRVFQDALALAREARRKSGIDSNLTSLGALASRSLMERMPAKAPVAVIGSGSLAGSIARYLTKRGDHPIRVSSRCPENALSLAMEVGGFGVGLDGMAPMLKDVAGIVTATAAPHPIVYAHHLADTAKPLAIVDLGVPPDCSPDVLTLDHVSYVSLSEIETKAQINSEERRERAAIASNIIHDGALAWAARR